jgi:hypothetical protein
VNVIVSATDPDSLAGRRDITSTGSGPKAMQVSTGWKSSLGHAPAGQATFLSVAACQRMPECHRHRPVVRVSGTAPMTSASSARASWRSVLVSSSRGGGYERGIGVWATTQPRKTTRRLEVRSDLPHSHIRSHRDGNVDVSVEGAYRPASLRFGVVAGVGDCDWGVCLIRVPTCDRWRSIAVRAASGSAARTASKISW